MKILSHVAPKRAMWVSAAAIKGAQTPVVSVKNTLGYYRKRLIWTLCTSPIMMAKATV
jgi:hypothetical protein